MNNIYKLSKLEELDEQEAFSFFNSIPDNEKEHLILYYLFLCSEENNKFLEHFKNEKICDIFFKYKDFAKIIDRFISSERFNGFLISPMHNFLSFLNLDVDNFILLISNYNINKLPFPKSINVFLKNHINLKFTEENKFKILESVERLNFLFTDLSFLIEFKEKIGFRPFLLKDHFDFNSTIEEFSFFINNFHLVEEQFKMNIIMNKFFGNIYFANIKYINLKRKDFFINFIKIHPNYFFELMNNFDFYFDLKEKEKNIFRKIFDEINTLIVIENF